MEKPLVSVVMPVYNGEKYIQRAVDSVFEQKVSLELIVIDDCSVDGTEKVLWMNTKPWGSTLFQK